MDNRVDRSWLLIDPSHQKLQAGAALDRALNEYK